MKNILITLLFIFLSFKSFSQNIENVYYDNFYLIDKSTTKIVESKVFQTTISFNIEKRTLSITSPALIEKFYVDDTNTDSNYFYFLTTCIDHNAKVLMMASLDAKRFILYDYDDLYYYVFLMNDI
jgi:hypothetical protein